MKPRIADCLLFLCLGFFVPVAPAADFTSTWDGSSNNWSDSSHWDSLLFPNNGNGGLTYDAVISSGTVTLDQAIGIESLNQTGGTIDGTSDLTASGMLTWTNGTMTGAGTTYANGGMNISGGLPKRLNGRVLNNAGAATWTGGQFLTGNGAVFNNQLGATFDVNFNGDFWNGVGGAESTFNNAGTFTKSGGTGGATQIDIPFHNTGAVEVNSGQLSLRGGGTSSGSFHVSEGSTLEISSGVSFAAGASVTGAGTTVLTGGTLTALSDVELTNLALTNSSATINGTSTITASGLITWSGGTMSGAGTTYANGGMNLSSGLPKFLNGRVLNNAGAATWTGGQFLTGNGAVFNNQLGATFDVNFDGNFWNGNGGAESTFNNAGTFTKSGGTGGATQIDIPFHNTGTVDINSGELHLRGGGTSSGSFAGAVGTTLDFNGGTHDLNTGSSVTSAGTVEIGSGTWNLNDGTFDVSGTTSITGGTANFNTTPTINQLNLSAGTLGGTADITASGLITWSGGTMSGAGTTYANGGMNLSSGLPKFLNGRVLNNAGAATWTGGQFLTGNGAVFNNQLGATFDVNFDGNFWNGNGGAESTFNNAGTFTKSGGTGGATQIDIPFHNTGAVEVNSGQLSLRGGGTSSGSFTGMAGTTLGFDGGTHDLNTGSSVTSAGTVQIGSGTWNFNDGTFDVSGTTAITGGTANFNTTPTINQLNLSAGTLGGTADITASGMLTWTGGTMSGAGTTYANGGMDLSGGLPKSLNGRVLNNAGAATWTGGQFLTGNGAVFNNQLGATFDVNFNGDFWNGHGGAQSQFNNAGTFTKSGGTGTTYFGVDFNNTGTVNVNSGTLKLGGLVSNAGSMNIQPSMNLTLDAAFFNDAEGIVTVDNGYFTAASLTTNDGELIFVNGSAATLAANLTNTGTINVAVASNLNVGGSYSGTGNVGIDDSQFTVVGNAAIGGSLNINNESLAQFDAGGNNSGAINILTDSSLTIDGAFANNGAILVDSGGELFLSPSQPFDNSGTLEVREGTVAIPKTNSIVVHPLGPLQSIAEATLAEGTWIARANGSIVLPQTSGGTPFELRHSDAVVILDGPSSAISAIDGLWSNAGTLELRGGRDLTLTGEPDPMMQFDAPVINTGTMQIGAGSTLTLGGNGISNQSGSRIEGEGAIEGSISAQGTTFSSNGTLSINQGSLSISTSVSTLAAGTLAVNVPMFVKNGGHFVIADGATLGGSGILELQDGLVTIDGTLNKQVRITGPVEIGGTISDATLDGAVVTTTAGAGFGLVNCFGENNIQSGVVNINGQLLVNDGSTLVLGAGASVIGSGAMDVLGLGSVIINGNLASTGDATITGSLAVEAGATAQAAIWHVVVKSLVKVTGKMKSPNPATVSGTLLVKGGGEVDLPDVMMLGIPGFDPAKFGGNGKTTGNVHAGTLSTVASGQSPGMLTIGGNMTFSGGSTLEFEVRDAQGTSGIDYDLLVVESDLINIGTTIDPMTITLVTLDLLNDPGEASNFNNTEDYSWTVATAIGTISGFSADTYVLDASAFQNDLGSGAFFLAVGDSGHALNVVFSASGFPPAIAGDFNLDGTVNAADYTVWRNGLGTAYTQTDYDVWKTHFGESASSGSAATTNAAVPEPATLVLLLAGIVTMCSPRRWSSHAVRTTQESKGSRCVGVKPEEGSD